MVGDEHANPAILEAGDNLLNVVHRDRIDAGEGLVEHHELRLRHECPRNLETAAFAARERVCLGFPQVLDAEFVEQPFQPRLALVPGDGQRLKNREQILLDRKLAEDGRLLREIADAAACALVHRLAGDILVVEQDATGSGRNEADDHIERRRLARAVRPEEPDDFALVELEVDVVHHRGAGGTS